MTEDEMIGWHHQLNGHEFEQAPGDGKDREAWSAVRPGVTASDFASIPSHIHNLVLFLLWLHLFIPSGVISPLISSGDG